MKSSFAAPDDPLSLDDRQIIASCNSFVGHYPRGAREVLAELAESLQPDERPDYYGAAPWVQQFEVDVAALLGKESATFMMSGTMAQQALLRVVCDMKANRTIALAPQSHLLEPEKHGLFHLHAIRTLEIGNRSELFELGDFEHLGEPIAALVIEVPDRTLGGDLRPWERLVEMTTAIRARGVWLHMDGARLWEAQEFYQKPAARVAELFDSVYVSFYKGLGGLAGAAIAGPEDIIGETLPWRERYGGRLYQMFPYVASARRSLDNLPKIAAFCRRAREFADSLSGLPDVRVRPDPPKTNMFQLLFRRDRARVEHAAREVARESGSWIIGRVQDTETPEWAFTEISVAEAGLDMGVGVFETLVARICDRAKD